MKLSKKYLALGLAASLFAASEAYAITDTVTANMAFDEVLALTNIVDIDFGIVQAGVVGTYVIDTAGTVTPSGGGVVIGGSPNAGSITITGSASQNITITAGNYIANNGVTLSNATCSYNGGAAVACSGVAGIPPGAGTTLLLGVQAVTDSSVAAGTPAAPTFDVTVVYS